MIVATVVGARPQFIKAAAVSRVLRATPGARQVLIHTGQHYDESMSDVFFEELEIPRPDHNLGIGSASHGAQTGRMLEAVEAVLVTEEPDWVLVYGDTNSTLAGALAAAKLHIRVAHVEAGLRSLNRRMPEEVNRVLTDHASDLLLAPTTAALENLAREGIGGSNVALVGDVMYDVALYFGDKAESESKALERLGLRPKEYALATVHRAENTDDPVRLAAILGGLSALAQRLPVVFPVHPRTRHRLTSEPLGGTSGLRLIDPVGYLDMVMLEKNAALVATDSGGVQKEAFFHRVPCATLRDETEWVELVELGWNRLVPPRDAASVGATLVAALGARGREASPYGDGRAAEKIAALLGSAARQVQDEGVEVLEPGRAEHQRNDRLPSERSRLDGGDIEAAEG
ncbi:MAG: UDP-N-acetylglucosamine 2-epimerase (non-hydrolyzing) [Deltaproteobacteria bacterium]|nr:UDP-N-acetylglucosamine 2-epimerase (non-hydrolyzing) [Deltaproteobacteria bacterium]